MQKLGISKALKFTCFSAMVAGTSLTLPAEEAQAAGTQVFGPLTYFNPAMMNIYCHQFYMTVGGDFFDLKGKYTGSNPAFTIPGRSAVGGSKSHDNMMYPYGQIMYRLSPKVVIGFDVSSPQVGLIKWTTGNAQGTRAKLRSFNYSGKISYAFNDDWTFGLGLDVLQLRKASVNFIVPNTGGRQFTSQGTGARAGWDAGLTYKINQGGWLGLSYKSRQYIQAKGQSNFPGVPWTITSQNANLPDTFLAQYMQFWSEKWMTFFEARYCLWKSAYNFYNVTSPAFAPGTNVPFKLGYKNSWSFLAFTRYQFAEQWAAIGGIEYDSNMQPKKYRPLIFPADQLWYFAAGLQYMPTKTTQIQVLYGYVTSSPKFNQVGFNTTGKAKLTGNQFDLSFTYKF